MLVTFLFVPSFSSFPNKKIMPSPKAISPAEAALKKQNPFCQEEYKAVKNGGYALGVSQGVAKSIEGGFAAQYSQNKTKRMAL